MGRLDSENLPTSCRGRQILHPASCRPVALQPAAFSGLAIIRLSQNLARPGNRCPEPTSLPPHRTHQSFLREFHPDRAAMRTVRSNRPWADWTRRTVPSAFGRLNCSPPRLLCQPAAFPGLAIIRLSQNLGQPSNRCWNLPHSRLTARSNPSFVSSVQIGRPCGQCGSGKARASLASRAAASLSR